MIFICVRNINSVQSGNPSALQVWEQLIFSQFILIRTAPVDQDIPSVFYFHHNSVSLSHIQTGDAEIFMRSVTDQQNCKAYHTCIYSPDFPRKNLTIFTFLHTRSVYPHRCCQNQIISNDLPHFRLSADPCTKRESPQQHCQELISSQNNPARNNSQKRSSDSD